ncbi:MAG: DUF5060 domain-containing protein, partial [Clostridia bacterium]|nr:DUF5060 domain-containing protein [Clostridia bacterium]
MKRMFALFLCFAFLGSMLSVGGSESVLAQSADYEAELWNPVEIRLVSTVNYDNAYTDAELDAVFTHEDGTVISLPGFWDGGQNW